MDGVVGGESLDAVSPEDGRRPFFDRLFEVRRLDVEPGAAPERLPSLDPQTLAPEAEPALINPEGVRGRLVDGGLGEEDATCILESFEGQLVRVPASSLQELDLSDPEAGGVDLCWPPRRRSGLRASPLADEADLAVFAEGVASTLARAGLCVAQLFLTPQERETAADETFDLGIWQLPTQELEAAYLGSRNGDKFSTLPLDDPDVESSGALADCDRRLSEVCMALEPFAPAYLGFEAWGRLNALVRVPLSGPGEEQALRPGPLSQKDYEDGKVVGHLNFLERRRLLLLMAVEAAPSSFLHLYPIGDEEDGVISIPVVSNRLYFVRTDMFGYSLVSPPGSSVSLLIQTWVLTEPAAPDVEDPKVVRLPLQLHSQRAHLMALTSRYPGDSFGPSCFWSFLSGGGDGLVRVPSCRWDMDMYYSDDRTAEGTTYAMHGGFCSDASVTMFDNELFLISADEAERMSPGQRVVLETGFEVLHRGGHSKATARGLSCGVFLGDSGNDWPYLCECQDAWRMLAQSNAVTGSRLSHCLGLRGPVSTTDTACSSSLVAVGLAHSSLRRADPSLARPVLATSSTSALALGCGLLLSPRLFILYCGPGMLSPRGRCFTYDSSADGYARGEGSGGLLLQCSDSDDDVNAMLACLVGSAINQDGRSASMTAPNGPAQQMCIRSSMAESGLVSNEVSVAECHGTGTALGDPIEVSAVRAVMQRRDAPLLNTSSKTNVGHMEAAAGMAGLIKCVLMLVASTAPANAHLALLNPHMDVNGYPVYFESEACDTGRNTGISGVSSFGFGGTNARGDLWSRCLRGARATEEVATAKWLEKRSMFYQRVFHYGAPGPHDFDKVFILGTWDCYSSMVEMDRVRRGVYAITVVLGEARREQFRFAVNEDHGQAIHPTSLSSPRGASIEGPDAQGKGKSWLIDGKADQVPAWTMYQVFLEWGFSWEHGEYKKVTWEPTESVAPPRLRTMLHKHTYAICGTWSSWTFRSMERCLDEEGLWTASVRLGLSGQEEFQLARDGDWAQTLYPAAAAPRSTDVPIRGPDGEGNGKNWLLRGTPGEVIRVQLRIVDGKLAVTTASETFGVRTWRSPVGGSDDWEEDYDDRGDGSPQYFVTGSWNGWGFSAMLREGRDLHRFRLRLGASGAEEFHLVVDRDWSKQLYPDCERAQQFEGELCGPDAHGHGLNWLVVGRPGAAFDLLLDLRERDGRRAVSWREVPAIAAPHS